MKKILFSLLAVMALTFTSCKDEAGLPGPGDPVNIAGECQGLYEGEWSYVSESTPDDVKTYPGSLTLTQRTTEGVAENYVVVLDAACAEFTANPLDASNPWPLTAPANITPAYKFFNALKTPFGNEFNGEVKKTDGQYDVYMTFKQTIKEGRKQFIYTFTFNGTRK